MEEPPNELPDRLLLFAPWRWSRIEQVAAIVWLLMGSSVLAFLAAWACGLIYKSP